VTLTFVYALVFVLTVAAGTHAAMLVDNYAAATNDRFENTDSPDQFFPLNYDLKTGNTQPTSYDFSGVGMNSSGRWGTLIAPNVIISANHFKATGTLTFKADNDPNGHEIQVGVSTTDRLRLNGTDLWIARLDHAVPSYINSYAYATETITKTQPNANPYFGDRVIMTGRSPDTYPTVLDQVYGTNTVSGMVLNATVGSLGTGTIDALRLDYTIFATPYESFFQVGDSGAPLFGDDGNGNLKLLGINSYISTSGGGYPVASFVSYTGNESNDIDAQIAAWAALIPDPGDFDVDGDVDADDIDALSAALLANSDFFIYDLNEDTVVNALDKDYLIQTILGTDYGDANLDGSVSIGDVGILANNFGATGVGWAQGDFNGDGDVTVGDIGILANNYNNATSSQPIPEPTSLILLGLASWACLGRRQQRTATQGHE